MNKMNKKGDLARILLPILAFALSLMAIVAILISNSNLEEKSSEVSNLISKIETNEQYMFEISKFIVKKSFNSNPTKETIQALALERSPTFEGTENFLGKLQRGEFQFTLSESIYVLEVPSIILKSQEGENSIERNMKLCLQFDSKGNYLNAC
jgi:hypothetical protein